MSGPTAAELRAKLDLLSFRGQELPDALAAAEAAYVEALRVGTEARVVEAFRVQCTSLYEAKLDVIAEAAQVQRDIMEADRRGS